MVLMICLCCLSRGQGSFRLRGEALCLCLLFNISLSGFSGGVRGDRRLYGPVRSSGDRVDGSWRAGAGRSVNGAVRGSDCGWREGGLLGCIVAWVAGNVAGVYTAGKIQVKYGGGCHDYLLRFG